MEFEHLASLRRTDEHIASPEKSSPCSTLRPQFYELANVAHRTVRDEKRIAALRGNSILAYLTRIHAMKTGMTDYRLNPAGLAPWNPVFVRAPPDRAVV